MGVIHHTRCPDCLCQHHEEAYAEIVPSEAASFPIVVYNVVPDAGIIVQQTVITTKQCCIVVNAATIGDSTIFDTSVEIERPFGTIRTTQEDICRSGDLYLLHHAAWEVLPAGTYTYYVINRAGSAKNISAAWIKIIASDCEG